MLQNQGFVEVMGTRRQWLHRALTSLCVSLARAAATPGNDDPAQIPTGRLFLAVSNHTVQPQQPDGLIVLDLETGRTKRVFDRWIGNTRMSPDGRFVAYPNFKGEDKEQGVWIIDVGKKTEPRRVFEKAGFVLWSRDSRRILVTGPETWLVDLEEKKPERLKLRDTDWVLDWSADGTQLLVAIAVPAKNVADHNYAIEVVNFEGTVRRRIQEPETEPFCFTLFHRFTPDARRVIFIRADGKFGSDLCSISIEGKDRVRLIHGTTGDSPSEFCISPDGKCVAVSTRVWKRRADGTFDSSKAFLSLAIYDMNGHLQRPVALPVDGIRAFDWLPTSR